MSDIDVPSLVKALQALSGEVSFDAQVTKMLVIAAETAGAESGALILNRDDALLVAVEMASGSDALLLREQPRIEDSDSISREIVRSVARTEKTVVLDDAGAASAFAADPDVVRRKARSVLCIALVHQGKLEGVLYLENNLTAGAFAEGRTEPLRVLCSQMAAALDNGSRLARLEALVEERTRGLREADAKLRKLDNQMTEGQMCGAFAHEMRNALASSDMYLKAVQGVDSAGKRTPHGKNAERLNEIYKIVRDHLSEDALTSVAELVKDIYKTEARVTDAVNGVERNIARAFRVTSLIIDYSRAGFETRGSESVSLTDVVNTIVRSLDIEWSKHKIDARVETSGEFVLTGTESHYYSIFNNLVINAHDALVEMKDARERALRISMLREEGAGILVRISDSGVGIKQENHAKLFEPFFSTKRGTGAGLGLGIVEKLVSLYGGSIQIESTFGVGTTVSVRLPDSSIVT